MTRAAHGDRPTPRPARRVARRAVAGAMLGLGTLGLVVPQGTAGAQGVEGVSRPVVAPGRSRVGVPCRVLYRVERYACRERGRYETVPEVVRAYAPANACRP